MTSFDYDGAAGTWSFPLVAVIGDWGVSGAVSCRMLGIPLSDPTQPCCSWHRAALAARVSPEWFIERGRM